MSMDTNRRSLETTEKGRELRQSWQHIGGDLAHPTKSNESDTDNNKQSTEEMNNSNTDGQSESPNLRGSTEMDNAGLSRHGLRLLREEGQVQLNEFGRYTETSGADLDLLVADYEA